MSTGPPYEAMAQKRPVTRVALDRSPVLELERIVVQFILAGLDERDSMVVGVAAQPDDPVAECVGDTKVEYVNQKALHGLALGHCEGDVTEASSEWGHVVLDAQLLALHARVQLENHTRRGDGAD